MKSLLALMPVLVLFGCKTENEIVNANSNCDSPTIEYLGQVYNTVQIGDQCWLKENLNVGTKIPGDQNMSNNGIVEKYCYKLKEDSCTKYGGFYQWNEMMQYSLTDGAQGICPSGWHIPTDEEWKVLEGTVDSVYKVGDPEWDLSQEKRGYDAGTQLRSSFGWSWNNNGPDTVGFSGLPSGGCYTTGINYYNVGEASLWWTSTNFNEENSWCRSIQSSSPLIGRSQLTKLDGFSVRCLKD